MGSILSEVSRPGSYSHRIPGAWRATSSLVNRIRQESGVDEGTGRLRSSRDKDGDKYRYRRRREERHKNLYIHIAAAFFLFYFIMSLFD